jgi:glycosyltransferase involved in cell wall biosynthesis
VTAVSASLFEWARLTGPVERWRVVANAIETGFAPALAEPMAARRRRLGLSPGALVVGSSALFSWTKGPEYLEAVLGSLARSDLPDLEFALVGRFPSELEAALRHAFERPGQESPRRRLVAIPSPSRSELADLLSALDLFLSTSLREGMPNAILEAMACGAPVAATAVNGCVELLDRGAAGLLLDPFDPRGGAQEVRALLADPARRARLAAAARRRVATEFGAERELERLREVYAQALAAIAPTSGAR